MQLLNHFQHINLTNDQRKALEQINAFLESDDKDIFMLKGYAGTGKTTLIEGMVSYLKAKKNAFRVMAPTGRAAKILREKTGFGETIHRSIYKLEEVEFISKEIQKGKKEKDESYKLLFPLERIEQKNTVLIIDEASMISSKESKHPIFQFGTDILLKDLLTYAQFHNYNTKIIFVGDPAQLPPVTDNKSWAFEPVLFNSKNLQVEETLLTEIKRQEEGLILKNAFTLRNKIKEDNPKELTFQYDSRSFVKLPTVELTQRYIEEFPSPELGNGVIIAFSNAQCFHYNNTIRKNYYPKNKNIVAGDVVQIVSNNYNSYPFPIYNGDFAKILEANENTETLSAPVWVEENGKKIRKIISLTFRRVKILLDHQDEPIESTIVDSLLNSTTRDLNYNEMKALYVNFIMRFEEEQKARKQNGLPTFKRHSDEFKRQMLADPYFNAIRCKYGYAITCHKAQGGEWNKVFVDYSGRVSLKKDPLRWCYTATTRGIESCYAINAPHFNAFSKFKISKIGKIGTVPKEAFVYDKVPISPFHNENQHRCKSMKYWGVLERMEGTPFEIEEVFSRDHLERYTVSYGDDAIQLEGHHNGSGIFEKGFSVISGNCEDRIKTELENIFNQPLRFNYTLEYTPSIKTLDELYSLMQDICSELEVPITNIVEFVENNFVRYYLQTDSLSANIQFYFNKNNHLTTALPKTYNCQEDLKLEQLIQKLKENVV